jgi:prepilin-type N-terminal cleavage/methylation domain-containing protein
VGFSIVELLVVMAIIAVLAGLTSAAIVKWLSLGPRNTTRAVLKSIKSKLDTQWEAVRDAASRDSGLEFQGFKATMPGQSNDAIRAAYIQAKLMQAFPTTFAEALNPAPLAPLPQYKTYLGVTTGNPSNAGTAPFEGAVCLMMILSVGPKTNASADEFATKADFTLANGLVVKGLTDGWNTPMAFARSATGGVVTSAGPDQNMATTADNLDTNSP